MTAPAICSTRRRFKPLAGNLASGCTSMRCGTLRYIMRLTAMSLCLMVGALLVFGAIALAIVLAVRKGGKPSPPPSAAPWPPGPGPGYPPAPGHQSHPAAPGYQGAPGGPVYPGTAGYPDPTQPPYPGPAQPPPPPGSQWPPA